MRGIRLIRVLVVVAIAAFANVPAASARTLVDPTTLTPPLKPTRICYQLGPYVQCDTSNDTTYEGLDAGPSVCGEIYESGHEVSNSTRWYQDGLLVRRAAQEHNTGFWSLSPTGTGPTVTFLKDFSWDEHFTIPGDIDSGVLTYRGGDVLVPALGTGLHDSGLAIPGDEWTLHGLFTSDDSSADLLCPLLVA
jgi:hypothetical protein